MKIGNLNYENWQLGLALLFAFVAVYGLYAWAPSFGVNWMNPATWVAFPGVVFFVAFLFTAYALWRQLMLAPEGFNLSFIALLLFGIYSLSNMSANWIVIAASVVGLWLLHSNKGKFERCQPTLY